jgi:hypothetical protein
MLRLYLSTPRFYSPPLPQITPALHVVPPTTAAPHSCPMDGFPPCPKDFSERWLRCRLFRRFISILFSVWRQQCPIVWAGYTPPCSNPHLRLGVACVFVGARRCLALPCFNPHLSGEGDRFSVGARYISPLFQSMPPRGVGVRAGQL